MAVINEKCDSTQDNNSSIHNNLSSNWHENNNDDDDDENSNDGDYVERNDNTDNVNDNLNNLPLPLDGYSISDKVVLFSINLFLINRVNFT